jgi:excisionase family DNA binding protein
MLKELPGISFLREWNMTTGMRGKAKKSPSISGKKVAAGRRGALLKLPDVLTLREAAAFLRVSEREVEALAAAQPLPARKVGAEWRFLKSALEDWLRTISPPAGKEALLALAGAFKEDPDLSNIVEAAYRQRGRPMVDAHP